MAKKSEPVASRECAAPDCSVEFTPKRSTAEYHSATCRQRAARARKAAKAEQVVPVDPDTGNAEHGLVRAVRMELEAARALDTVAGQLALQLARRIANPDEAGLSALSKELRSLLAEAKGAAVVPADPAAEAESEDEDDEVTRVRKIREAKAAAAAASAGGA
ncbi:MAG TPA: hypothetical protein VIP28_05020 [Nocardioides sp.]